MADSEGGASGRKQDPRVERRRPDPSEPPQRGRTLAGLWGDSDREGFRRLYLTRDLTVFAEFRLDDVLDTVDVPPEQSPFLGEQATRVELREDAEVEITQSARLNEIDEFDLDVRFGTGGPRPLANVFAASSGRLACYEPGEPITDPCNYTCDICITSKGPAGRDCPDPGYGSANCGGATGGTCETCYTDCGMCPSEYGATRCGTCYTEPGYTNCRRHGRVR